MPLLKTRWFLEIVQAREERVDRWTLVGFAAAACSGLVHGLEQAQAAASQGGVQGRFEKEASHQLATLRVALPRVLAVAGGMRTPS